jgi:hypothetical protein
MTISASTETFFGKSVRDFSFGDQVLPQEKSKDCVYRLVQEYEADQTQQELLDQFLDQTRGFGVEALIIGCWANGPEDSPQEFIDRLIERRDELPMLRALFIGDMTYEENEISWIIQGDYNALLRAFPGLVELRIRGAGSLKIGPIEHHGLRTLVIESGGIPAAVLRSLAKSTLPALKHLELWLGTDEYGFDGDLNDCIAVVEGLRPERLTYLGLRDFYKADELAEWIAGQGFVAKLETLDFSLGTIGDVGATALLNSPHVKALKTLDLSHHYISEAVASKLATLGINVVLADQQEDEDDDGYRYVAVGE